MTATGRSDSRSTNDMPIAEPDREGLTTQGRPTRSIARASAAPAARSRSAGASMVAQDGVRTPAASRASLARALSKAISHANGGVPVNGIPTSWRTRCTVPSSPSFP